jgi:phosphatidate cytidylyltransferase
MSRVLSGVVLAAVFFAIVWFSSATVLLLVALAVCAGAFREYATLVQQIGAELPRAPTLVATLAALVIVPFPYVAGEAVVGVGLIVIAIAAMARLGSASATPDFSPALLGVAAGALSVIYLGLPLGALVGIHIFGGRGAVVLLVGTVAVSDTAQYYTGRLLGRHLLAPRLSPKKTVEGAIGGLVAAPILLYFAGPQFVPVAAPLTIAAVGLILGVAGIAGDLFESMLKRAANIKDSSALIPGHGGILDRIDALLFATPVFYVYIRWQYTI